MPNIVEAGYLENPYLTEDYLSGQIYNGIRCQIDRRIDNTHAVKEQVSRQIASIHPINSQIDRQTSITHSVKEQILNLLGAVHSVLSEIDQAIASSHAIKQQIEQAISTVHAVKEQIRGQITLPHGIATQADRQIATASHAKHTEIRRGSVLFLNCESYLEDPYLEGPYLAPCFNAHVRSEIARELTQPHDVRSQINRKIDSSHSVKSEIEQRIDAIHRVSEQVLRLASHKIHSQITQVLYNTTQLRVLLNFPSRGVSGTNWTANSTMAGDFSVDNLNTDIVEQVWRSNNAKTGITLVCDSEVPQGIFVDTLAFLNHNFTTSASILWEASNDPGFSSVGFTHVLTSTRTNIYYIAPILPTEGFRYHRFTIDDTTNTSDFLQIGTIVFGSSIIFQGESFVDQVTRQTVHFADKIKTEAFTNVSNDRAIKTAIGLEFRNLQFNKGNYTSMREIFESARTSFKCLWIPTPQYASRFAVFGKLDAIPLETHNDFGNNNDYVSFSVNVDESL